MGKNSGVQYCDDSLSLTAGCSGCELFNPKAAPDESRCYAERLTRRYAGGKGWVKSFTSPELFLDRMKKAEQWSDLTGKDREGKPWLNGMPRVIFVDDMGELFDPKLPDMDSWLPDILFRMDSTPHIYLLLTKQARRMATYFDTHPCPSNVWPGVSVTDTGKLPRVAHLLDIKAKYRWISYEPAWDWVDFTKCPNTDGGTENALKEISWLVVGGESRQGKSEPHPFDVTWMRRTIQACQAAAVPCFSKQLGSHPFTTEQPADHTKRFYTPGKWVDGKFFPRLDDSHGGDWLEWPDDLKVRELPRP